MASSDVRKMISAPLKIAIPIPIGINEQIRLKAGMKARTALPFFGFAPLKSLFVGQKVQRGIILICISAILKDSYIIIIQNQQLTSLYVPRKC